MGLVVLSACTGNDGSGDDSGVEVAEQGGGAGDAGARAAAQDSEDSAALSTGGDSAPADVDLIIDRDLIRTATIELESDDIDGLLVNLDAVVSAQRGIIESEDTQTDDAGDISSASIELRVPVDRFDAAVDAIADLGVLVREQTSTEDVTTKVADVDARVESARRSIDQLRLLFSQATQLGDIIRLESELSERQADLESLEAQQRSLARQTALSSIHISITRPEKEPEPAPDEDRAGFVEGIKSGWSGLVAFVQGTTHVVGLVLPLGTLALVIAVPIWLLVRRSHPLNRKEPGV